MARDRYAVGNTFLQSFMAGYGFVDNIQARKREEARLEEQLAYRRARQERMDSIVFENQRFAREDRQRLAQFRERGREAAAIMGSENPNLDTLASEYSDIPGVLDFVKQERDRLGLRGHIQTAFQGDPGYQPGAAAGSPDTLPAQAGQQQGGGLSSMAVSAADPNMGLSPEPPAPNALASVARSNLTQDQINDQVAAGLLSEQEAAAIVQERRDNALIQPVDALERAQRARRRRARDQELEAAGQEVANATRIAESFVDMGDDDGNVYRDWTPTQAVQWYHANRNNINDPALQERMDRMMESRVQNSLEASRAIMDDQNIEIGSNEWNNAARQYSLGLGLAQESAIIRSPAELAGADGRGVSRNNTAMIDSQINAAGQGRPAPLPGNPSQHRAQIAVANRGSNTTRISKAYQEAAYGLLSREIIDIGIYGQMIRTGAPLGELLAARGIEQRYVSGNPEQDLWLETRHADGTVTRQLAVPARKVPSLSDLQDQYRNTFADDAVQHLYQNIAPTLNTEDDQERGRRTVNSFLADLAQHEATARANGYSYQNRNDVALLYQRWADMHVIRDVYNRELSGGWSNTPTFSDTYGNVDMNIFNRDFDTKIREIIREEELETSGGNPLRLTGLKQIGGAEVQYLRSQFPQETARMTDDQIREIVLDQERQLGGF